MALIPAAMEKRPGVAVNTSPSAAKVRLAFVRRWHLVIRHEGSGGAPDITVVRIRRCPLEAVAASWSPWEKITIGVPVAAGESLSIRETDDCSEAMEVELTAAGATTAGLYLAGA